MVEHHNLWSLGLGPLLSHSRRAKTLVDELFLSPCNEDTVRLTKDCARSTCFWLTTLDAADPTSPLTRRNLDRAPLRHADYSSKWRVTHWKSVNTNAFIGTNPENAADFCVARRSGGVLAIVSGRLATRELLARIDGSPGLAHMWTRLLREGIQGALLGISDYQVLMRHTSLTNTGCRC